MPFSDAELAYLATQRLGRLATVDSSGAPQEPPMPGTSREIIRVHPDRIISFGL